MKNILLLILVFAATASKAQTYYPPLVGDTWETMDPSELGWCEDSILQMENWLENSTTKAFIVLKDGKIVIEKYFGTFTQDSLYVWNSAGKTLTAYAVGIAQTEGDLDIDDATTDYLGAGWTSATAPQENAITILNQLTMTSGLDDGVADPFCTTPDCLEYLAAPNTRWAYHNGPYTLLDAVIENATGANLSSYVYSKIGSKIGMMGTYVTIGYNHIFVSKARGMARFGLLLQSNGMWNSTPVQTDLNYLQAMRTPSQSLNPSYGYLTWLNGQSGYQIPGVQFLFSGPLLPNAPADLYAAEGKNGQIINVVPSTGMVVVRMGATLGSSLVSTQYNDTIWQYINRLDCGLSVQKEELSDLKIGIDQLQRNVLIIGLQPSDEIEVINASGTLMPVRREENIFDFKSATSGIYFIRINRNGYERVFKVPLN
jgi:CubicO group peptidase (beta-lactamase class C family)